MYDEFNRIRAQLCLGPITINPTLESSSLSNANSVCSAAPVGSNYIYSGYGYSATYTLDDLVVKANGTYTTSRTTWVCNTDSASNGNPDSIKFQRFVVVPTQEVGCSYTTTSCVKNVNGVNYNYYYYFCMFKTWVANTTRVVPLTSCTCSPTSAPTTAAPTPTTKAPTPTTKAPTPTPTVSPTPTTKAPTPTTKAPTPTPTPTTTPAPSDPIRSAWMDGHNSARTCVGSAPLVWNATLEADALQWAKIMAQTCQMYHSNSTYRKGQGENLWFFQASGKTDATIITAGVEGWNREIIGWNCTSNTCSLQAKNQAVTLNTFPITLTLNACGHYTQVVWSQTKTVGCAMALCSPSTAPATSTPRYLGACRYWPPGNMVVNGVAQNPISSCKTCASTVRTLTTQGSNTTPNASQRSFFASDSEIVVFALAIFVAVAVISIFVVLLVSVFKKRTSHNDEYQLLENK